MRKRSVPEAARDTMPTEGLLANAGNHLGEVEVASLGAADRHYVGRVEWWELLRARVTGVLTYATEYTIEV